MYSIGIDIGGTKIAGALVDESGQIVKELRVPTPVEDPAALVDAVVGVIRELRADHEVLGAGVAMAGFIDAAQSAVIYGTNFGWKNYPLKAEIEAKLDIPVIIENDANAAAWAEYRFGAGKGFQHMVMLTLGTGVGGAVIVDGRMLRGGFGVAGELGHMRVVPNGVECGCGQHGCIESYASGTALVRTARELVASGDPLGARLGELAEQAGELTGVQVYEAILEGDAGARKLLADVGSWTGQAIASLSAILDPQIVVIGGGVSAAGELLLGSIRGAYRKHMPAAGFRPELKIVTAEFVNDAGVVGAADLARVSLASR
ncbi:ROK family glucokinase [Rhodoluna sp. KAS3]|uniref:ROK family glucokinase n=1 Tax=Rhodoluna sp. KAS3 TaxID=942880 RepID=UPI00222E37F3|nr:ROK family glucokinase [Rhodoluna sp. KAS3]BDS48905.1 glucokinase [Rhodoluna sp. KAS3]